MKKKISQEEKVQSEDNQQQEDMNQEIENLKVQNQTLQELNSLKSQEYFRMLLLSQMEKNNQVQLEIMNSLKEIPTEIREIRNLLENYLREEENESETN